VKMKLISTKVRLKTPIFTVTDDRAVDPDGFEIRRLIVQHAGSAVMMPVDGKGRILLVRQYRLPARKFLWELPAGRLDPGESVLQAARRELAEETGYRARRWSKLISYYASPGYIAEKMNIWVARELTAGEQHPTEDERIETRWFAPAEIHRLILAGKIQDGKTIIGYYAWMDRGRQR
jgi:ADP-ribose pyrophosphatase